MVHLNVLHPYLINCLQLCAQFPKSMLEVPDYRVPFVYTLVENKKEILYKKIFEVVIQHVAQLSITSKYQSTVMIDIEL